MNKDTILVYFALKYEGDFNRIYSAICRHEQINLNDYNRIMNKLDSKYITMLDSRYPEYLKDKMNPPIVLFYHGNIDLIDHGIVEPVLGQIMHSDNRFISNVVPIIDNNQLVFDYVIMAESHRDLIYLKGHLNSKGIPLKDYKKSKDKNLER